MILKGRMSGFTLIEVMIALVIFAVVSVALVKNTTMSLRQSAAIEDRTVAWWLAENQMTKLRIVPRNDDNFPSVGVDRESVDIGDGRWEIEIATEATENDFVRRVVVSVYREARDQPDAELTGFIGRY